MRLEFSVLGALAIAAIAVSAAAVTGSFTGAADPLPAATVTVTEPAPEPAEPSPTPSDAHTTFDVDPENAPTIVLTVSKDAAHGYNIHMETTHFTFVPMKVNMERVLGEGHVHLYVDGVMIERLYGPDAHTDAGTDTSTFTVYLAASDHEEYSLNGVPIIAEVHGLGTSG